MAIVINSFAAAASILSLIISLHTFFRTIPDDKESKKRVIRRYVIAWVGLVILTIYTSFSLVRSVSVEEQTGSLKTYPSGQHVIYYPKPYKNPPHLEILCLGTLPESAFYPKIIEQKQNSFTIEVGGSYGQYLDWKATGILAKE